MENEIKISDEKRQLLNDSYTEDLKDVLKTNSTIPTHTPKKFVDCFWLYYDDATTYRLYVYINNEWKYTSLT